MVDITMCINKVCPIRFSCYRYRADSKSKWQSMAWYKPNNKGNCESFWSIESCPTDSLVPIADLIKMEQYS